MSQRRTVSFIEGVDFSKFDLERYLAGRRGQVAFARTLFIAEHSREHHEQAVRKLLSMLKPATMNLNLYKEVIDSYGSDVGVVAPDSVWVEKTNDRITRELDTLETVLRNAKKDEDNERMTVATREIGDFFYEKGEYKTSLK